jgi:ATP citrate (pro-S)-lyase
VGLSFQKAGLIRRPATFLSSISDDRGEEVTYAGLPISQVVASEKGIGNVLGLLWFKVIIPFL